METINDVICALIHKAFWSVTVVVVLLMARRRQTSHRSELSTA